MKMKRGHQATAVLMSALLACTGVFLNGCGHAADRNAGGALTHSPLPASGEIEVWSWNIAAKSLQSLQPAFHQDNPDVHVNIDMTGASMSTRLMLSLAARVGAPDVSTLQLTDAPHYIATHRLTDLTAVAGQYRGQFPPSRLIPCTMNGRIYAIPWDMGPCAVFYKRGVFAKYGIDPDKIQTWDDYINAGQEIVKKSGGRTKMLPLASDDAETMLEMLLQQTQGQIFDAQGRVAVNSPQVRIALQAIRKLRRSGICADIPAYGQEWMSSFNDDSIASYPDAVWLAGIIKDATTDVPGKKPDWGVFRLPAVTPGGLRVANLGGSVLVIPDSCPNKQAAWKFVQYALCTPQGQVSQYKKYDLYPSFLPALATPAMDEPDLFFGGQRVGRYFAWHVDQIWPLNIPPTWNEAKLYIQQDLSGWMSAGMPDESALLVDLSRKLHERLEVPVSPAPGLEASASPRRLQGSESRPLSVRQALVRMGGDVRRSEERLSERSEFTPHRSRTSPPTRAQDASALPDPILSILNTSLQTAILVPALRNQPQ